MANIEQRVAAIQLRQCPIRRIALTRSSAVGCGGAAVPSRAVIDGVAVCVIHIEEKAMAGLLLQGYLERVIVRIDYVAPVAQVPIDVVRKTVVRRRSRSATSVARPCAAEIVGKY